MKAQKKLNIVLIVLIIILISIISFIGIFYQDKNKMVDKIPDYTLGTDLIGYRKVVLEVSETEEESTDEENEVNEESNNEEEINSEETNAEDESVEEGNSDSETTEETNNYDNYIKSASIIKKRLASMNVNDYTVRCDESTGQIEITIPENEQTDYILADITQKGNFEITDNTTGEVLMNNDDIKSVDVAIAESSYSSSSSVYMDINFNGKGSTKFKNITKTYQNVVANETAEDETEETTDENEVVDEENATDETTENSGEDTETTENVDESSEEDTEEETAKEVSLNIDGTSMMTTTFSEVIDNGVLSLTFGSGSTGDDLKIIKYEADSLASILENDPMPLQYEVTGNLYISSSIEQNDINILIYIGIAVALIIFVITIIKYKTKGLAVSISSIGFIGLYLLVLRYANVVISLEGMFAIGVAFVVNHIFNMMFLNRLKRNVEKSFTEAMKKFALSMIPLLILSLVCCFAGWMQIFSFGMVIFWGLIVSVIYNFVITQLFIKNMS